MSTHVVIDRHLSESTHLIRSCVLRGKPQDYCCRKLLYFFPYKGILFATKLSFSGQFFIPAPSFTCDIFQAGIAAGRALLAGNLASANFMVVITDGEATFGGDPTIEADAARAEGTTIFAVGVGEARCLEYSCSGRPSGVHEATVKSLRLPSGCICRLMAEPHPVLRFQEFGFD